MSGTDQRFSVAIVGAGMSGATAAYYLRQAFPKACISIFDAAGRVGGRMHAITFADGLVETGASIFHASNHYMHSFAKQYDLPISGDGKSSSRLSFFDGPHKRNFSTFGVPSFLVDVKLAWHFGFQLLRVKWYTTRLIRKFGGIYDLQDNGKCFENPATLLQALSPEFVAMTKSTYADWLKKKLFVGPKLLSELAFALTANNYCQNLDVHAFVGFITMATVTGGLRYVKSGNEQVPKHMVADALRENSSNHNKQLIHATVTSIEPAANGKHLLTYQAQAARSTKSEEYDYVVVAAPLHQDSTLQVDPKWQLPSSRTYQSVDRSLIHLPLKNDYFQIPSDVNTDKYQSVIFPTREFYNDDPNCLFRSIISLENKTSDHSAVWTIFSDPKRTSKPVKQLLAAYFDPSAAIYSTSTFSKRWLAYPKYRAFEDPHKEMGSFILGPGLYYANAMEQIASCMECAAIGGRNVALLIAEDRRRLHDTT